MTSPDTTNRVVAIVQARLGSTRFPRKVLAPVLGEPALVHLIRRLRRSSVLDDIVLAIPETQTDQALVDFARLHGVTVSIGSEQDVLSRYAHAATESDADVIVRVTGDCPMIDPEVVDEAVKEFLSSDAEYVRTDGSFPDGFDVEVCSAQSLLDADRQASEPFDREHVTPYIRRAAGPKVRELNCGPPTELRVTLDEPDDLTVLRDVFDHFGHACFGVADVIELGACRPELFAANQHLIRDEGATMGEGQKLWRRAKRVIPGGNMLLSKRSEQFLDEGWPAYFSRAKGCRVWDLDGRELIDVGLMGVGTNILGYGDERVDEAVRRVVRDGNMSTLNCPEEVHLAERLCELHPWADMAKVARSGGEACAIAVRIARAASGKPAVAICGYHGWHDWYLSANLADNEALDGHLLPGLTPNGVPRNLQGLTRPFFYNDLDALRDILAEGDVGTVIMEVQRSSNPAPGFLEGVRDLTRAHGCVLIFDECTSGFRQVLGGLHLVHGVEPDLATFGKALGNGYAVTAVIGRREVMSAAEATFISSTFWTERIGPAAALATLDAMADDDAPARVHDIGGQVRQIWHDVLADIGLTGATDGLPALARFTVDGWNPAVMRQLLIAAMLKRGFIAGPAVYSSTAHTADVLGRYAEALGDALTEIGDSPELEDSAETQSQTVGNFGRLA